MRPDPGQLNVPVNQHRSASVLGWAGQGFGTRLLLCTHSLISSQALTFSASCPGPWPSLQTLANLSVYLPWRCQCKRSGQLHLVLQLPGTRTQPLGTLRSVPGVIGWGHCSVQTVPDHPDSGGARQSREHHVGGGMHKGHLKSPFQWERETGAQRLRALTALREN